MRLVLFILALCLPGIALANARLVEVHCSAALFRMEGMSLDHKALILTAGHCTNLGSAKDPVARELVFPGPGQVLRDQPDIGHVDIRGSDGTFTRHRYSRLILATMTGVDLAILELDETYRSILESQPGLEIYDLSPVAAWPGAPMQVVSARSNSDFTCEVDKIVPILKEDPWTWTNVVRFRASPLCTFFGGVSGSPVLDRHHHIIAVANTRSDPGEPCSSYAPCEIGEDGAPTVAPIGQSYATPTDDLYGCYSASRQAFDFELPSCRLIHADPSPGALAGGNAARPYAGG